MRGAFEGKFIVAVLPDFESSVPLVLGSASGQKDTSEVVFQPSPAIPEVQKDFMLKVLGNMTNWTDADTRQTTVTVSAEASLEAVPRSMSVTVSLQPFASCRYTTSTFTGSNAVFSHLTKDKIFLTIVPRDTDNLRITNTPMNVLGNTYLKAMLASETVPDIALGIRSGPNGGHLAFVSDTSRAGQYTLRVSMTDAWDENTGTVTACMLQQYTFTIKCAVNFVADPKDGYRCKPASKAFDAVCIGAAIEIDDRLLVSNEGKTSAETGTSLTVRVNASQSNTTLQLQPLQHMRQAMVKDSMVEMALKEDGAFALVLKNGDQTCQLIAHLDVIPSQRECTNGQVRIGSECSAARATAAVRHMPWISTCMPTHPDTHAGSNGGCVDIGVQTEPRPR